MTARSEALGVWTGRELLIWGGRTSEGQALSDGAAYDPVTNRWREIAAPLTPRVRSTAVWTGREVLVLGGDVVTGPVVAPSPSMGRAMMEGAAYDPSVDKWRPLPPSPLPKSTPFTPAVWTGKGLVVVAGGPSVFLPSPAPGPTPPATAVAPAATSPAGATTAPAATAPSSIPSAPPLPPVESAPAAPAPPAATTVPGLPAASYDPAADRWRQLPRVPVDNRSVPSLAWTGRSVLAVSPKLSGATYTPGARTWTSLPAPPENAKVQSFAAFWTGREVFLVGSGGLAFHPTDSRWRRLPEVEVPPQVEGEVTAVWTGRLLVMWGGFGKVGDKGSGWMYRPPT